MTAATTGAPLPVDVGSLSDDELVTAMTRARRQASQAQAAELSAVAELARRRRAETVDAATVEVISPEDYLLDEVAAALTLTARSAADLVDFATALAQRLPGTLAALGAGDIDYCKARTLWHGTRLIDTALTARVEYAVLPKAGEQTTGEIRAKIRRLIRRLDPEAFDRRRRAAEEQRRVELTGDDNGTAHLSGCDLPATAAASAFDRVNAIATAIRADGDTRAIDQLRADVFLGLLDGSHTFPEPARRTRQDAPSERAWTGLDDLTAAGIARVARDALDRLTTRAPDPHHGRTGTIPTAPTAREGSGPPGGRLPECHHNIAVLIQQAGQRISAALTDLKRPWCSTAHTAARPADRHATATRDPSGRHAGDAPERHGAAGYRPPAAMRRLIEDRDGRCGYPGCRRPARRADIDHTIPYDKGGPTCPCNLSVLCRRHHTLKQTKGWNLVQIWPGVLLWITPTGHWHIVAPTDRE
jgi:hypothetical protein